VNRSEKLDDRKKDKWDKDTMISVSELRKLKASLLEPKKARAIVGELKHLDQETNKNEGERNPSCACHPPPRAICLSATEEEFDREGDRSSKPERQRPYVMNLLAIIPTAGDVLGAAVNKTGAASVLASGVGGIMASTGAHKGLLNPPKDRASILICRRLPVCFNRTFH